MVTYSSIYTYCNKILTTRSAVNCIFYFYAGIQTDNKITLTSMYIVKYGIKTLSILLPCMYIASSLEPLICQIKVNLTPVIVPVICFHGDYVMKIFI